MIHALWSDQHFGHRNILEYAERPFETVEEMLETMVKNYNEVVGPGDVCLWGGDCFLGGLDGKKTLARFNGVKLLVLGNHDKAAAAMFEMGFSAVAHEMFLRMGGRNVRVHHYPYWYEPKKGEPLVDRHGREVTLKTLEKQKARAPRRIKGEVLIHGHVHSTKKRQDNMVHIGVDAWDYRPATWAEVEAEVAKI